MHNIPASVNPVTPLLQWDIWQSLYGQCMMPALEHSIHPETKKQTWNHYISPQIYIVWENPRIGGHFGFMQIKILKLRYMKPCSNKIILGSNIGIISCHYLCLNKRTFLVTYLQQSTIIKTWFTIYHHHQDFMHNIPAPVNPVTPLLFQ